MIKSFTSIHTCDNGAEVILSTTPQLIVSTIPASYSAGRVVTLSVTKCTITASIFGYVVPTGEDKFKLVLNGLSWASEYGSVRSVDVLNDEYNTEAEAERVLLRTLTAAFYNAVKEIRFRELDKLIQ